MTVRIELFEYPSKEEMLKILSESPLNKINIDGTLLNRLDLKPIEQLKYGINITDILVLFENRIFQTKLSYTFAMGYFNRGIPDDHWSRPSINGGTEYHPDFENEHWKNKIHFEYHIDAFFQKAFTVLDVFGHLLFKYYDLMPVRKNGRVQDITFNNAFWNLKYQRKDIYLHNKFGKIKFSNNYKRVSKIRNAIIHSQPPYMVHNQFETKKGITTARIKYTPSKKLVEDMHDLSICIQEMVEIFCTHITEKNGSNHVE